MPFVVIVLKTTTEVERCFSKVLKHTNKQCSKHTLILTLKLILLK